MTTPAKTGEDRSPSVGVRMAAEPRVLDTTMLVSVPHCKAVFLAVCMWMTGCAGTDMHDQTPQGPGSARTSTGEALTPEAARDRVVIGSSTKADVGATLGKAIVIAFDSGYEVWVYRWRGTDSTLRAATELVLLFDPSGLMTKARLRPGYTTRN
jgi:hypothetical protein